MKIRDYLKTEQFRQLEKMTQSKRSLRKEDHINWHKMMGTDNRGMKRGKGGAMRNV
ncbi:hypothetical protein ACTHAL_001308 [Priestia flexa]|jgi:hypothetical protein|uniref:hypothetical protein n=1 Tax=Priestia flexa TaxID=86664 RepID=UPI001EF52DC8|nr:hypothetical protein [Priestia flexa]MCG7314128.1 hypothetical protein [Priestia flexa]